MAPLCSQAVPQPLTPSHPRHTRGHPPTPRGIDAGPGLQEGTGARPGAAGLGGRGPGTRLPRPGASERPPPSDSAGGAGGGGGRGGDSVPALKRVTRGVADLTPALCAAGTATPWRLLPSVTSKPTLQFKGPMDNNQPASFTICKMEPEVPPQILEIQRKCFRPDVSFAQLALGLLGNVVPRAPERTLFSVVNN